MAEYVMVPVEPDDTMEQAGADAARKYMRETGGNSPKVIYRAMLAARPKAPPVGEAVAWYESEPHTHDWPVHDLFFGFASLAHSGQMYRGKKPPERNGNRLTPLYPPEAIAAAVAAERERVLSGLVVLLMLPGLTDGESRLVTCIIDTIRAGAAEKEDTRG